MMDVVCVFYLAQILIGMVSGGPESDLLRKTVSVSESGAPVRGRLTVVSGIDFLHANRSAERTKRQTPNRHAQRFTKEEKITLLKKHNELRRLAKASDMTLMTWNDHLEALAQDWANGCKFYHRPYRDKTNTGFQYVGENLYAGTGGYDAGQVVQYLYDEIDYYNYNTMKCQPNQMCGHYTQIVWASSRALGCALNFCLTLERTTFENSYFIVCNYGPGGNYPGVRPFRKGDACTQCGKGNEYCSVGLCSPIPSIIGGSSQIFSSSVAVLTLALQFSVTSQAIFS